VDEIYRRRGFEWGTPRGADLAACCAAWAGMPLVFQPGTEWNYGVSTDVLGRVVEVVSGQPLDRFFAERIFAPLGMTETTFSVPPGSPDAERLAALYSPHPETGVLHRDESLGAAALRPPTCLSGGGGLVSSAADYLRFTQMLLRGGELDGRRVLGRRTVAYMTRNHLPGGADLERMGRPMFSESAMTGMGFGLGFSVVLDPAATKVLCSPGEFAWGGVASTAFWVDPAEELTALFFTQLLPSSTHPIRSQLRTLVNQAVI
jgi:CubicO group peptidase (beta-lactamase class C family)